MFQTMYDISMGTRAGLLNRSFTIAMLILVVYQLWRLFTSYLKLKNWANRLTILEQEAREEGVVTIAETNVLPPIDAYSRLWEMIPSMAIMFGLLGTFIGLTVSLSEIPVTGDVLAIQKGLSLSIPSMGTAFWTSLSGLVVAIAIRITNAIIASNFKHYVIDRLLMSEPQVIEALESAAFQKGRSGALLRPHGIRELLWHQNRILNQTLARVAPQISEGIARGLGQDPDKSLQNQLGKFIEEQQKMNKMLYEELIELRKELKKLNSPNMNYESNKTVAEIPAITDSSE